MGVTERRVTDMCRNGKLSGALKQGGIWYVPVDTQRPADGRVRTGAYIKADTRRKLPLPVGISDYRLASTQYYYVDKTMLIRDFLDERPMVSLFTRPRRFGKTLTMDMLRTFFEISNEDTSVYFKDKAIWRAGKRYQAYQGKYPVVYVTFKDIKCETWEETLEKLAEVIGNEYARHEVLLASDRCNAVDKAYFRRVMERLASPTELTSSFMTLTKMLHEHYQIAPIIIIDEYDTPIQQGHVRGFYDKVILFMRNLFSGGLKDNHHLSFGFLTGILRIAQESIFSGLNNLTINSILDEKYSSYFGFTSDEVRAMATYYDAGDKFQEICEWYDGYQFGETDIFNPWSVIKYFSNNHRPGAYWQSTGSNEIIGEVLSEAGADIYEHLKTILQGETFLTYIDTDVIYPEIRRRPTTVYSFLLVAGYLKVISAEPGFAGGQMCKVALPNREIAIVYKKEILDQLNDIVPPSLAVSIQEALFTGNEDALKQNLRSLLLESASVYDTIGENFYQGLVLGLCAMMDSLYTVRSNRESGEGRYDIALMPKSKMLPGILIELKSAGKGERNGLKKLAEAALSQIEEKQYETELTSQGISKIYRYGVAFHDKDVEIVMA
ncbi:MAG: AAA family ATPase [Solobacterium sp.]|nr:AAA family ATPase [Solobacterium sp.]